MNDIDKLIKINAELREELGEAYQNLYLIRQNNAILKERLRLSEE